MGVHLATEHAFELEPAHLAFEPLRIASDVLGGDLVALTFGQLQELRGVGDAVGRAIDFGDVSGETGALLAELLRALRLRPDGRILELPSYLFEALFLEIVLKETPVARRCARLDL
jgi:hypothetical protein